MKVQILAGLFLKQTAKTQLCLNAVSKGKDINTAHQPMQIFPGVNIPANSLRG